MAKSLPVFALLLNAFVWGVSWWPFRALHEAGLHPLWATALMYALALAGLALLRPAALGAVVRQPGLWLLAVSAGLTNVAFNWAVTVGDVVRVVLLFYLMPAWSVLLAWWLLGERPTRAAGLRLVLAFAGVALVLLPETGSRARLTASLSAADLLALAGGLCFALTNVTLLRLRAVPGDARMAAMFVGGAVLAATGAGLGGWAGAIALPPPLALPWVAIAIALSAAFVLGNFALQYGAARLAAGTTALVMLSEVIFASVSSVLLTAAVLEWRTVVGGGLIVLAALLSTLRPRRPHPG